MKNEERNKSMDEYKTIFVPPLLPHGVPILHLAEESHIDKAIRECDRKARAWDELRMWLRDKDVPNTEYVLHKMDELLDPPKPKSKLERLKKIVIDRQNCGKCWTRETILLEIDRLEQEPD